MENVNCTHCTKQFGAVDSFVEVETAAIVGSTQCCWPDHLHYPGKERPPPRQKQPTIVLMVMMIMEMMVLTIIVRTLRNVVGGGRERPPPGQ